MRTGRINGKVPAGIFCGIEKKEFHAVIFPYGTVVLLHLIHKIFHLHFRGNESRIKRRIIKAEFNLRLCLRRLTRGVIVERLHRTKLPR